MVSRNLRPAIAIFARSPSPGKAKTRLIPLLGAREAAQFQRLLIADTLRKATSVARSLDAYIFLTGRVSDLASSCSARRPRWRFARQRGANLGERLEHAFRRLLPCHSSLLVMGTDSPTLPVRLLRQAVRELRFSEAVLGPCPDGGYYLVGLRNTARAALGKLFRPVRWGSAFAFRDTLRNLRRADLICSILEPWDDVDRPADLRRLERELAGSRGARRLAPATWRFLRSKL